MPASYVAWADNVLGAATDDVVVSFARVSRGRSPLGNFRWNLHADGRLFRAEHSGKDPQPGVAVDQPLSAKPVSTLSPAKVAEVRAALVKLDYFKHPGFEGIEGSKGGVYVIVRASSTDNVRHTVVFENASSKLVDYLASVSAP